MSFASRTPVRIALLAFAFLFLGFATVALAQVEPERPANLIPRLLVALVTRKWLVVAGLAIATIVSAAFSHRLGIAKVIPWFATDAGATVWTFVLATIGAAATSLSLGQPLSLITLQAAFGVGVVAIGGYTGLRKLLGPSGVGRWIPWLDRFAVAFGPKVTGDGPAKPTEAGK
jgi:hypothetical protein